MRLGYLRLCGGALGPMGSSWDPMARGTKGVNDVEGVKGAELLQARFLHKLARAHGKATIVAYYKCGG